MGDRFRHARHVMRVGAVLGVGFAVFLVARWTLIPSDFGVLGYYRAGALNDVRARPIAYAGRAACMECHDGAYDPPEPEDDAPARKTALKTPLDPVKDNKHFKLNCEACHGPLQKHVADEDKEMAGAEGRFRRLVPRLSSHARRATEDPAAGRTRHSQEEW